MTKPDSPASVRFDDVLLSDRFSLRRSWQSLQRRQREGQEVGAELQAWQRRFEQSQQRLAQRQALTPQLDCPEELPIAAHRQAIIDLLKTRQVLVVCGETGSGKSTQLPKFCLDAGLGRRAMIGHTQPRRLAARSIARRLDEELQCPGAVGSKIRFSDQTDQRTLVKLMTDGILLAETQSDRFLEQYDAIIIDEAHERSLNIDFLLGFLRRLQGKRPDLKIIITSATIDADRFAEHFADESGPAPILNVEGRGYPVEMRYLPWDEVVETDRDDADDRYDLSRHVIAGVEQILRAGPGDALVFLPTERDIREVSHRLTGHFKRRGHGGSLELLPLYARLPQREQQQIFQPTGSARRIVLATNVAESSLTVPRIDYVIDAGTARISRYSPRSKIQRLPIEPISQASANQRAGRCGRTGPGLCVRLYSEDDFLGRPEFTTPEIRRTNLASVILQTKTLKLGAIDEFPFLDPPRPEAVREGIKTLFEIGALDDRHELTRVGRQLGRMPVDPRVARMLVAAAESDVLPEVLVIAAALEIQDPRDRPVDKRQAADEAHAIFRDGQSDFVSYLRLWDFYHRQREALSRSQLRKRCRQHFLSFNRMREWDEVYRQLRRLATETLGESNRYGPKRRGKGAAPKRNAKLHVGPPRLQADAPEDKSALDDARYAAVHQALLTGLLSGIAQQTEKREYQAAGGLKLKLWPGSVCADRPPKWIVAAEWVETTQAYARSVASIQVAWLEPLAKHLTKSSFSDPHWSRKQARTFCYQRVNLFGLPIVLRRRVPLPPIDPQTARQLLIDHGLVQQQLPTRARCVQHNRRLREALQRWAAKTRRREWVVDPLMILQFYHTHLPADVVDRETLERFDRDLSVPPWAKPSASDDDEAWLHAMQTAGAEHGPFMTPADLLPQQELTVAPAQFPDAIEVQGNAFPVAYHYEPGSDRDGLTVTVPQAALSQVSEHRLGWLVPGLLETKLTALIKALPKRIRRNLVPAAEVARAVHDELAPRFGDIPFLPAVCEAFSRRADMPVQPSDFVPEKLPEYLRPVVRVVDEAGQTIAEDRDVVQLQTAYAATDSGTPASQTGASGEAINATPTRDFPSDPIPEQVEVRRGGVILRQYPALVDENDQVRLQWFSDRDSAAAAHAGGTMRLFAIKEHKELRSQVRWLPGGKQARILLARVIPADTFEPALIDLIARIAFVEQQPLVRDAATFEQRRQQRAEKIAVATQQIAKWLPAWGEAYHEARSGWETPRGDRESVPLDDIRRQVAGLTEAGFLSRFPWRWLQHYPRYFKAIAYRIDKLRSGGEARDREAMQTLRDLSAQIEAAAAQAVTPEAAAAIEAEFHWRLQELRVSLFAQPLGTAEKVSPTRIEKQLQQLRAG